MINDILNENVFKSIWWKCSLSGLKGLMPFTNLINIHLLASSTGKNKNENTMSADKFPSLKL